VRLFDSIKNVVATVVEIAHTRLELLSVEVQEEVARLGQLLFLGAVTLLLSTLGLAFLGFMLIVAFWDEHRVLVAIAVALAFLVAAAVSGYRLRRGIIEKPPVFSALLGELVKDRDELRL
jgi:uncharacterized membrane protein YqjE